MAEKPARIPKTDLAEIRGNLARLAFFGGNLSATSRDTGVPHTTLRQWRNAYPDAYAQIAERLSAEIEARAVTELGETTLEAIKASGLAVKLERERLENGEVRDAAASAQRLMTTAGIATDKRLLLEGRPTSITASTVEEDLRSLRAKAIPDAEVIVSPSKALESHAEGDS